MICYSWVVTLQSLFTNASWILSRNSALLWPSSLWYCHLIIDSIDIRFIHYLRVSFKKFPKIIFFIFYTFVVYEPAEWNFPASRGLSRRGKNERKFVASPWETSASREVKNTNTKKFLLIGYIPSSLDCFSITKKLQRVFSGTLQIGDVQFYRKLKYANLVERNSIGTHCLITRRGPDVFVYTSSSVAFSLMQREKSTVIFPTHFICVWLRTCSTISSWHERIRNSLICCRIQQKIHETHKICSWCQHIRGSHEEFAYQL